MRIACLGCLVAVTVAVIATSSISASVLQLRLVAENDTAETQSLVFHHADHDETLRVETRVAFDESAVRSASYIEDIGGMRGVVIKFTPDAARRFAEFTGSHLHRRLAIIVSGRLITAPVIRMPILEGQAQITGTMSEDEAKQMAAEINNAIKKPEV